MNIGELIQGVSVAKRKLRHPQAGDLYTPITPEVLALFERMRAEHGSWREVAALTETKLKVLRNIRHIAYTVPKKNPETGKRDGKKRYRTSISMRLMDRLCSGTGVGSVEEFMWFTAEDMVRLGLWKPVRHVAGKERYVDGVQITPPQEGL